MLVEWHERAREKPQSIYDFVKIFIQLESNVD